MIFDELNNLKTEKTEKTRSMPYEQYFGEMDLSKEDIERRIEVARSLENVYLLLISIIVSYARFGIGSHEWIIERGVEETFEVLNNHMIVKSNILDRVYEAITDFIEKALEHSDDDYYTSEDRAKFNAENESNSYCNIDDYNNAIDSDKQFKQWKTQKDMRVRYTHYEVDDDVLPIDQPFSVGDSLMMFPKDTSLGASPEEIVNCRCTIKYF